MCEKAEVLNNEDMAKGWKNSLKIPFGPNLNLNTKIRTEMNKSHTEGTGMDESIPIINGRKDAAECRFLTG